MRKLRKEWKRDVSVVMTALLVCGSVSVPAEAKEAGGFIRTNGLAAVLDQEPGVKTTEVPLSEQDKKQLEKEETVYVIANADGSPQKLIVSDWLKNGMGSGAVEDATELTDIVNVKGDESFRQKEGSLGVWDAAGNDIYYQGNIQKELPVDMKITYRLNGREISPEELAGQSGRVNIRFDYTNRQKESVMVGEKEEELYVPFVLLTSLVLDNESFRNIEVSNGKVINDGERTVVMGYAMPGLKDNFDIGSEDFDVEELDIPDYVELTADVTDFELATTLTVATNEIFGDMDLDTQEKMDELSGDMDELEDAMNELMDGTAELYDGVLELYDGTEELTDGMNELDDGARKLNDGAGDLRNGARDLRDGIGTLKTGAGSLAAGVKQLSEGLKQITQNDKALNDGTASLYAGLLEMANGQLKGLSDMGIPVAVLTQPKTPQEAESFLTAINNNLAVVQGLLGKPAEVRAMVEKMVTAQLGGISVKSVENPEVPAVSEEENLQKESFESQPAEESAPDVPDVDKTEGQDAVRPAETDTTTEEAVNKEEDKLSVQVKDTQEQIQEPVSEENSQEDAPEAEVQEKEMVMVQAGPGASDPAQVIAALKAQMVDKMTVQLMQTLQMTEGTLKLLEGAYRLNTGIGSYTQGVDQINAGVQELMKNVPALNSGINALDDGAGKLADGAGELKDGTSELKDGAGELRDGGQELRDGVEELRDGSKKLKDGTVELNDEGIRKLIDMFRGDMQELSDRMDGVKSAAKAYQSFSGISDGVQGNVRFVYKTAAIEK